MTDSKSMQRNENLTEKEIVEAALGLIKAEGVEGLSMRKLSKVLRKSPMAMYYYVADKSALLDLVASVALRDIDIPESDVDWESRLRALIGNIDEQLRSHPGIGEILLDRMLGADRLVLNEMMNILVDAGFSDEDVLMAYATIHTYLFGRYRFATAPATASAHDADSPHVDDTVARLTPKIAGLSGRRFFEFGVETLIGGLHARLVAAPDAKR